MEIAPAAVEMAEILQCRNWQHTAIGNYSKWPVSLRTALNMLLATPSPMSLAWGKAYLQFSNKSFHSIVPATVSLLPGNSAAENFSTIWHTLQPAFEKAWNGHLVRVHNIRFQNETQTDPLSFCCTPVLQDDGQTGGILITLLPNLLALENSNKSINEKRVQQPNNDLRHLAIQSTVAMATLRGHDLVIEMANEAMLKGIWQKEIEDVRQKKLLEVFPSLQMQQLPALLEKVFSTGKSVKQNESVQVFDTSSGLKRYYLDIVLAPLLEEDGTVSGVILTANDVTEKVKTRQLIEDAEQRSRLAIEATAMGTFDWDLVTQQFKPSARLIEIFGLSSEEVVTQRMLLNAFHPADKINRDAALQAAFAKGSLEYEARIIKPDHSVCWVKIYGKITYNELRKPMRMYGTVTDITKEKVTLLALEESESRLQIAVSTAQLGTYDVDISTSRIVCSSRFYDIMDIPADKNLIRDDILKIIYPDDVKTRNEAHEAALNSGRLDYESRIVWRDNSIHWIKVKSRVLVNEKKIACRILGTVMDITEQKRYITQLQESEQRFKVIADTAPVMIWMAGLDMLCYFFNKGWLDYTGRTLEQEVGNGWADGVYPDDLNTCLNIYTTAFGNREEFYMEYRLRMHDGCYHWISDRGVPHFSNDGVFIGYVGSCMDIDVQKKLNDQLTKNEARLRIAAISGELGTWDYDPATDELFWDDATANVVGVEYRSPSSVELFWSVVHPDDFDRISYKVGQSLNPDIAATFDDEFRIIHPATKKERWISGKGKAFFKNGVPYRFAGTALDSTEKRLALEALQERELLFKTIANTSPVGLWLTNEIAVNTFVNNTWINWTGIPFAEQVNDGWYKVVVDEYREGMEKTFRAAFQKQEKFSAQFRFTNRDNELRWCLTEGFPYYNNDNTLAGYAGSVTDITEQLNQIDALKKSEERFRLLANAMPQFVWTSGSDGILNYFNQSVYDYTGIDPTDLEQSRGWLNIVHPDDRAENMRRWIRSIETGEDYILEHRFKNKKNEYRWQLSRALPQRASDGSIQMWIGTSTDIHDQKLLAEELENKVRYRTAELQKMNDELLQQKEFVEVVLDSSLILVAVFDPQKNILSFNKKCELVFGIKKENVIGRPLHHVFPGIELSQTYLNIERAIGGETFHISSYKSVVNSRFYESYFVPLRDKYNNVYAVLMTAHDITDILQSTEKLKQAYAILEEQNEALERSNHELESFSYIASHDLQEPLRKIQTFIELLHRNMHNVEISEKYFDKITSSAQRMAALIRDVLDYSRLARQGEAFTPVDLNDVIENVMIDLELLITEKKASIIYNNLPTIKGIPLQINQLFTNLAGNALKFSGNNPVIKISGERITNTEAEQVQGLQQNQVYTHITFTDNGIGFEQQFAEKIFAIFQRLNNRQYSGTGIGLALCKKIVENHKGIIKAHSQPGMGATFHIYLPV